MDLTSIKTFFNNIDSLIYDDFKFLESALNTSFEEDAFLSFNSNFFGNVVVIQNDLTKTNNQKLWKKMEKKSCVYAFKAFGNGTIPFGLNLHKGQKDRNIKNGQMIYVGKTESTIRRIHSHYSSNYSKSSLHLGYNADLKAISKMYIFILKKDFSEHKNYILERMEEYMHRHLDVAIGNSRN